MGVVEVNTRDEQRKERRPGPSNTTCFIILFTYF